MRTRDDSLRWAEIGTTLFIDAAVFDGESHLPGWTRRHVITHVAANADALNNLVTWAATGVTTPMYESPEARAADIERGLVMPADELAAWVGRSSAALTEAMQQLTEEQWSAEVVTVQGRTVPATQIPWLRAREVCVHAVDLDAGVEFSDLPHDFLEALCADVVAKRGSTPDVTAPLPERAAWLTGRPHRIPEAPVLEAWL